MTHRGFSRRMTLASDSAMCCSYFRVLVASLLFTSIAWLVSWGGSSMNGQPVLPGQPVPPKPDEKDKQPRLPEDENVPFTFPYYRDAKRQLEGARDYLAFKNIPWDTVCPLLQNILDLQSDSFFDTRQVVGGQVRLHRISVKTEANRVIAEFPEEGLLYYQQTYGAAASNRLDEAIKANYDLPILADVSQRYFHTRAGGEATVLMGSLHLERGNYLEAAHSFERLMDRPKSEEFLTPMTLFKACLAFKRSGEERHAKLLVTALSKLETATDRQGLTIGRDTFKFDALKAEIDRKVDLLRASTAVGMWAMSGGNPQRNGTIGGGPPFLDPTFQFSMLYTGDEEANAWIKEQFERLFARNNRAPERSPLPAFFPVVTKDLVVFRTYHGLYAVNTRDRLVNGKIVQAGELEWISPSGFGANQMLSKGHDASEVQVQRTVKTWWDVYTQAGVTSVLYENPQLGSLAHDGKTVYFIDDVAIPPPPNMADPNFGGVQQNQYLPRSSRLAKAVNAGRLVAVDLESGLVKWELGRVIPEKGGAPLPPPLDEEAADKTNSAFELCLDAIFLGPPLPLNGKLYALIEQGGAVRLMCLDPNTMVVVPGQTRRPALLWSQKLGKPDNTLPQDSIRRYQNCQLAAGDGILICPTNSGAIVAVDIMSRSLLWAHGYNKNQQNFDPRNPRRDPRTGRILPNVQLKPDRWRFGGPIITQGRVVFTAYDSDTLDCLDLRSGRVLWSIPRTTNDLYSAVVDDVVVVVGKNQVRGYHLTGESASRPKVAFEPVALDSRVPTGHGAGGEGVYYIPLRSDNAGRNNIPPAEIWAIDVTNGQIVSKTTARKRNDSADLARYGLGNLVFHNGMVFAQSPWEVYCFPQLEQKKAEMNKLLAANPNDPLGLLARGELLLDGGQLTEAIADFKAAEKNNLPPEKRPVWRDKLYSAYTELIRKDFSAGEKYLEEYKSLCELPIDPDLEPIEKQNRLDETERRQRLYLYLLARGREKQGKLADAFDHYLALANLGEGKSLLDMPDDPNVRTRPDVWARGRIEDMFERADDPEATKVLRERVQTEWDRVKDGNDIKELKEFVTVFGPYFQVGAEAQFLLAEKLLETRNEQDINDAQTYLEQLRRTAKDPAIQARAAEAQARLMLSNRQMEDAVGKYMDLGQKFPNVVIRDGKTGADFMRDLLTDKRLLPYLAPSKYPLPTRIQAEQKTAVRATNVGVRYDVEPGGDLFPAYRRYRFAIDTRISGNNQWAIIATDPNTGATKAEFRNLERPLFSNPQQFPYSKYVQGNGRLLLVQLGTWVYCLDLADGKERWRKDLLEDMPGKNQSIRITNTTADDELTVQFADGFYLTLGRAAVIQPGYAALLTIDGLEVVEPLTQRVLWTRRNLPERTQIFGDARHLVVVETAADRKPVSVKLLRASDGTVVEGSPDSGRVLAAAKSFEIMGHKALLNEGGDGKPRVIRLYDLATGKDLWRKEYDAKAVPVTSPNNDWVGAISPDGKVELRNIRTGKVAPPLQIDAENLADDLKPCKEAELFADEERFYLFLNRDPSLPSTNKTSRQNISNTNTIRSHPVNGPLYAFDRQSGKRLWYFSDGIFENMYLVEEQFADLPALVFTGPIRQNNNRITYPIIVLEKDRGRLVFDRDLNWTGNYFYGMNVDPKNGTIDLNRYDLRITISPADEAAE